MTSDGGQRAEGGRDALGKAPAGAPASKPAGKAPQDKRGPGRARRKAPPDRSLEEKVDDIHHRLVSRRGAELLGMLDILSSRRKLIWLNFNAGLARGVGFFLGVTLIGALVLGGVALAFNYAARTLGYKDLTLEEAVGSTVRKFSEIRSLVAEAEHEVQRETQAAKARAVGTEPDPDLPELELPGAKGKSLGK
ncbi:MAG: DUF5665 domain-containing protein [Planctomycetota bacterium]|jgi:hypothetical protein